MLNMFVKDKGAKAASSNIAPSNDYKARETTVEAGQEIGHEETSGGTDVTVGLAKEPRQKENKHSISTDDLKDNTKGKARDRNDSGSQQSNINVNDVFKFMVKEMEGKGTPVSVASRSELFPPDIDDEKLQKWFQSNSNRFTLVKRGGQLTYVLVLKKECKFCLDYTSAKGCNKAEPCRFYHICKNYLSGYCRFGSKKCKFSHDLLDEYNMKLSKEFGYNLVFSSAEICNVVRARYPHVCPLWMKGDCQDVSCYKLHICQRYLHDQCLDGEQCLQNHDRFTDHNKLILDAYAMGHWNERAFRKMVIIETDPPQEITPSEPRNKMAARPKEVKTSSRANRVLVQLPDRRPYLGTSLQDDVAESDRGKNVDEHCRIDKELDVTYTKQSTAITGRDAGLEPDLPGNTAGHTEEIDANTVICELALARNCDGKTCGRYHNRDSNLPYIWQVNLFGAWVNLARAEDVERAYCGRLDHTDPLLVRSGGLTGTVILSFNGAHINARILFDDEDGQQYTEARRISTASYTTADLASDSYLTQWRWFWKDNDGLWKLYDEDTMQYTLETKYLAGQRHYLFTRENYKFKNKVDFVAMTQENLEYGTKRDIIRRPLLVNGHSIRLGAMAPRLRPFPPIEVPLPQGWVPWDHVSDFELVMLSSDSKDYKDTADKFFATMPRHKIQVDCIYRVQSHSQWDAFCRKEREMRTTLERTRPGESLEKRDLFHGTDNLDTVRGICVHNFDQRVSGKNATMYGDGTYFARDAKYSHSYTKGPERFIFLAHVLVGQFTEGKREYRRPPALPGSRLGLYDSCVDNLANPSMFILFDKSQHYPAFLIQYKDVAIEHDMYIRPSPSGSSISRSPSRTLNPSHTSVAYPSPGATAYSSPGATAYPSPGATAYPSPGATAYPSQGAMAYPTHRVTSSPSSPPPSKALPKKDSGCCVQ